MALYKNGDWLTHTHDAAFDATHTPGAHVPHSGIYRCINCGREVVAEQARTFPPQNHHQHPQKGAVLWKMVVYADHDPK